MRRGAMLSPPSRHNPLTRAQSTTAQKQPKQCLPQWQVGVTGGSQQFGGDLLVGQGRGHPWGSPLPPPRLPAPLLSSLVTPG